MIKLASEKRVCADYLGFFIASKEEANIQIKRAETVYEWIKSYLKGEKILE